MKFLSNELFQCVTFMLQATNFSLLKLKRFCNPMTSYYFNTILDKTVLQKKKKKTHSLASLIFSMIVGAFQLNIPRFLPLNAIITANSRGQCVQSKESQSQNLFAELPHSSQRPQFAFCKRRRVTQSFS